MASSGRAAAAGPTPRSVDGRLGLMDLAPTLALQKTPHTRPHPFPRLSTPHRDMRLIGIASEPGHSLLQCLGSSSSSRRVARRGARGPPGGVPSVVGSMRPSRVSTPAFRHRWIRVRTRRSCPRRRTRLSHTSWCTRSKNVSRSRSTTHVSPAWMYACACPTAWWALRGGRTPSLLSEKVGSHSSQNRPNQIARFRSSALCRSISATNV